VGKEKGNLWVDVQRGGVKVHHRFFKEERSHFTERASGEKKNNKKREWSHKGGRLR